MFHRHQVNVSLNFDMFLLICVFLLNFFQVQISVTDWFSHCVVFIRSWFQSGPQRLAHKVVIPIRTTMPRSRFRFSNLDHVQFVSSWFQFGPQCLVREFMAPIWSIPSSCQVRGSNLDDTVKFKVCDSDMDHDVQFASSWFHSRPQCQVCEFVVPIWTWTSSSQGFGFNLDHNVQFTTSQFQSGPRLVRKLIVPVYTTTSRSRIHGSNLDHKVQFTASRFQSLSQRLIHKLLAPI